MILVMWNVSDCVLLSHVHFIVITEGEDEDTEWASEVLTEAATIEHNKGEDQELFFFFGGDVSSDVIYFEFYSSVSQGRSDWV
jgi:hypothetical protein